MGIRLQLEFEGRSRMCSGAGSQSHIPGGERRMYQKWGMSCAVQGSLGLEPAGVAAGLSGPRGAGRGASVRSKSLLWWLCSGKSQVRTERPLSVEGVDPGSWQRHLQVTTTHTEL